MAKVEWSAGIDSVSGALSKPGTNPQHSCAKMLLGTHRVAATTNPNCNRLYLRKKVKRSTPVTADEQAARTRFAAVARAVLARKQDLPKIAGDLAAFNAQKDNANGDDEKRVLAERRHKLSHSDQDDRKLRCDEKDGFLVESQKSKVERKELRLGASLNFL